MDEFDPERFEKKYANYFSELQRAYKRAFERMNETYDSATVHAIDQQILNESEPQYEGDGTFSIDMPTNPYERLHDIDIDRDTFETLLDTYVEELRHQHRQVFGFEG